MLKICALLLFATLAQGGHLEIDYSPSSIILPDPQSEAQLALFDAPTIIANLLGLTADKPPKWQGHGDLLNRPAAGLIILSRQHTSGVKAYKLLNKASTDDYDIATLGDLIDLQMSNTEATLIQITETDIASNRAGGFDAFAKVDNLQTTTGSENIDVFLENIQRLINWLNQAKLGHSAADLYTVTVPATESTTTRDSITATLKQLIDAARKAYGDNVLVATIAAENVQKLMAPSEKLKADEINLVSRQKRAAEAETKPANVVTFYNDNYPAMFSIILFTSLALAITIAFISYCMWTIEPDKDAIIYRLTMPRQAKKDL